MKHIVGLALMAGLALPALAADRYTIDPRHTFPSFQVNHLGFSYQSGRFNSVEGEVTLDRAAGKGQVDVRIAAASIDMGLDEWDKHMREADFFNAEAFPTLTFKSNTFTFANNAPVEVQGELTLLGVTRPVTLKVNHFHCGFHLMNRKSMCGANLTTTIKRSEFGMKTYVPFVGDEVYIQIPVEAIKAE